MAQKTAPASTQQHVIEETHEYHVSYMDSQTGRTMVEEFADLPAAERFANLQLRDDDCWAIVEEVEIRNHLRLVA
ncbi:hypothetical protein AB0N65_06015 [Paenarthrobacter sp. NPDC089322]|uniref:hypothetical protein n=1 Tax=Paenarthrobacter sp. NPDC089322 TaxID=3155065 RepID=UPI00342CD432